MRSGIAVTVIIPALNEERSIGHVVEDIPVWVDDVIVVDNGSVDATAAVAREAGARVVSEQRRGYGRACLAGMAEVGGDGVVVFLDGDYSDYPEQMDRLMDPIVYGEADMVIGSRTRGIVEGGALTPPQRFGNALACGLMRLFWDAPFTDLGPFRAIRRDTLMSLGMTDKTYGWTVEMQVKAARRGIRCREVPVDYRRRIGVSKVSGTIRGVIGAGVKILGIILLAILDRGPAGGESS